MTISTSQSYLTSMAEGWNHGNKILQCMFVGVYSPVVASVALQSARKQPCPRTVPHSQQRIVEVRHKKPPHFIVAYSSGCYFNGSTSIRFWVNCEMRGVRAGGVQSTVCTVGVSGISRVSCIRITPRLDQESSLCHHASLSLAKICQSHVKHTTDGN